VSCEGGNIPITANLLAALGKLRLRSESRYLWMDAICINQENLRERSEQVKLMKEIYSKATRVLIWIGEEGPSTGQAFDLLGDLAKAWCSYEILRQPRYIPSPSSLPFDESLFRVENSSLWEEIRDLISRSYFDRIWIVQEIIAATQATVLCGDCSISWTSFHQGIAVIQRCPFIQQQPSSSLLGICSIETQFHRGGCSMIQLLGFLDNSKFTDPRDRVYPILGLVSVYGRRYPANFTPDYSSSVYRVYQDTAEWIIQDQDSLEILDLLNGPPEMRSIKGMSSWVPDFSTEPFGCRLDLTDQRLRMHFKATTDSKDRGERISIINNREGHRLSVRGYLVDQIKTVYETFTSKNLASSVLFLFKDHLASYKVNESTHVDIASFWQTLIGVETSRPGGDQFDYELAFWSWMFILMLKERNIALEATNRTSELDFSSCCNGLGLESELMRIDPALSYIVENLRVTNLTSKHLQTGAEIFQRECTTRLCSLKGDLGRSFFVTSKGHIGIGPIGPPGACVGDDVAVLTTATTPFILREFPSLEFRKERRKEKIHQPQELQKDRAEEHLKLFGTPMTVKEITNIDVPLDGPAYRVIVSNCYVHGISDGSYFRRRADWNLELLELG
jgi:hypothetical protein